MISPFGAGHIVAAPANLHRPYTGL